MESAWMIIYRARDAERLAASLRSKDIQALQLYRPIHHNTPFHTDRAYPEAESAYRELLYLPSSLTLTAAEITRVCDAVEEAVRA
jgi:dTDP-4-amino-4,6-dideoxygalactose transaminase